MSYVRWGEDGSSVYVFASVGGYVECCGCAFETRIVEPYTNALGQQMTFALGSRYLHSPAEVVTHMREHLDNGGVVPNYLLDENLYEPQVFQVPTRESAND